MNRQFNVNILDSDNGDQQTRAVFEGTTVGSLFSQVKPGRSLANYKIMVNGHTANDSRVLNPGDSVSISPTKIAGA